MINSITYEGKELELFKHAKNWKTYFSGQIKPFIKGRVLEVGAGLGATTQLLNDGTAKQWTLLEPDEKMNDLLRNKKSKNEFQANCHIKKGTLLDVNEKYDTIIYIDVLEHIKSDVEEVKLAASLLEPGGSIIILAPAFNFLYSPFDKQIGHYRRYNKKMLSDIIPENLIQFRTGYYDTIGFFAALINRLFLKQEYPTQKQILFWDKLMIPVSKITDKIFFHQFGKSVISIWNKQV